MDERVTQTKAVPAELAGEMTLRPQYLSEYCGQSSTKTICRYISRLPG